MKKIFEAVKDNPLFSRIAFSNLERMLDCLSARTVLYKKEEIILLPGDAINFVGLILAGSVKIMKEDIEGRVTMLTELSISEIYGYHPCTSCKVF